MKVPRAQIVNVIAERTLTLKDPVRLAQVIAAYLLDEHRTADLEPLLRDIMQYRLDHGLLEATITSAHELTTATHTEIRKILSASHPNVKKQQLDSEINPDVIGGIRVTLPNEQLDETIRTKLDRFKQLIKVDG